MKKKVVLISLMLSASTIGLAFAADKDEEGYHYQSNFLLNNKPSIQVASNTRHDLPLSLQYKNKKQQQTRPAVAATTPSPSFTPPPVMPQNTFQPAQFSSSDPLMVIRFNQPSVYYHASLYNVIKKALEIKPSANFEVESLIPSTGSESKDTESKRVALENGKKIMESISTIGLPSDRIKINYKGSNEVINNEVHIFVR